MQNLEAFQLTRLVEEARGVCKEFDQCSYILEGLVEA